MAIDFSQFRNPNLLEILQEAGQLSADLNLREITPMSVLIILNQHYTNELEKIFQVMGVSSPTLYSTIADYISNHAERSTSQQDNIFLSDQLGSALMLTQLIESRIPQNMFPNAPLVTSLFQSEGPLQTIGMRLGITPDRIRYVLTYGLSAQPVTRPLSPHHIHPCYDEDTSGCDMSNQESIGIGLQEELNAINEFCAGMSQIQSKRSLRHIGCDCVIVGDTGTGKNFLADLIAKRLQDVGIVDSAECIVVDAVNWSNFSQDFEENMQSLQNKILIVDNAHKLLNNNNPHGAGQLDKLFVKMDKKEERPVIILVGHPSILNSFFDNNPAIRHKFQFYFQRKEYTVDELVDICAYWLMHKYNKSLRNDARKRLKGIIRHKMRNRNSSWANAHTVVEMADNIFMAMRRRGADQISPNDIEGTEEHESSVDEILAKLDDFVGIDEIKEEVLNIIHEIQYDQERFGTAPSINSHFVFTGNPGTGKTTIARVFADVLKAMDVLPSGHIVEADRSKLVGQYVGETAIKTNAIIDSAIGGILFIDEAYTLVNDVNSTTSFGKEAVDTLLKRLEDDRGKFVCIVAGYPKEMNDFLSSNPGMYSRFNRHIEFRDYSAEELELIFKRLVAKNQFKIDANALPSVKNCFLSLHTTRTKNFGNAREVRKIFEETKKRQGKRLAQLRTNRQYSPEMAFVFTADDLPMQSHREINVEECQRKLDSLVGLRNVKQEIRSLASYLTLEKLRSQALGRQFTPPTDHYLFLGNPGTGKTTVARILGEIFYALGISKTTNFIEADRSSLVAPYVGQTAIKTNKLIDNALGGILFIDEAYTLIQGDNDTFGQEAVDTLLKRMEDDRGKFVCIAAGYSHEMQRFIASNSGLQSRFNKTMHFDDYSQPELEEILKRKIRKENFLLTPDAESALSQAVAQLFRSRSRNFGNAREINNLFQKIKERQSLRLMNSLNRSHPSNQEILTLKGVDFL